MTVKKAFGSRIITGATAALALAALSSCEATKIQGVDYSNPGIVSVQVLDQNNAGVVGAQVSIEVSNSSPPLVIIRSTSAGQPPGVAGFDLMPRGVQTVWVDPPTGYSGGGRANSKTVEVLGGQTSTVQLTLTKTP
jgi:hypothetical protein